MPVDPRDLDAVAATTAQVYRQAEADLVALVASYLGRGLDEPTWARDRLAAVRELRAAADSIVTRLDQAGAGAFRDAAARAFRAGAASALVELAPDPDTRRRALTAVGTLPSYGATEALAAAVHRDVGERTRNVLRDVGDAYRSVIASVVAAGTLTGRTRRQQAAAAWRALVDRGLTGFTDRSGRRWHLASYVEMATRTTAQRAAVAGQVDQLDALDVHLVYVSNAPQECHLCRPWEGRILRTNPGPTGRVRVPSALTGDPLDVPVAATLTAAQAAGLFHPGCRHSVSAYLPGATRLPDRPTADPEGDAARQRQRELERRIRRHKTRQAAALDGQDARREGARVRAAQRALREHLADHPQLKRLRYRESIGIGQTNPGPGATPAGALDPVAPDSGRTYTPRELADDYRQRVVPTARQRSALYGYTGGDFAGINGHLRTGSPVFDDYRDQAAALAELAEGYRLPAPVRLLRAVTGGNYLPAGPLVGQTLEGDGFQSATLAATPPAGFRYADTVLRITAPAGTPAIVVNGVGNGADHEDEVVLPHGTRYLVTAEEHREGRRWLTVTALPPGTPPPSPDTSSGASPTPAVPSASSAPPRPADLSDDELEGAMQDALLAEELDRFDELAAESDRRDERRRAADEAAAADEERRAVERERWRVRQAVRDERRAAEFDRLLTAGVDEEEAVARVYGQSVRQQRIAAATTSLRDAGYRGARFDDLARQAYRDDVHHRYRQAEDATRGHLLNRQAEAAGIDPRALFSGSEARARKHASDELLEWWDEHGRPTFAEFKAQLLGDTAGAGRMRAERAGFLA